MGDRSSIEWTDATWNPVRGCSRVSAGCEHCYAERIAARFDGPSKPFENLIHKTTQGWNGKIKLVPEMLDQPWRWTRGRRIFVNSMSDLFHENVPFEYIAAVFWVMSVTTRHTYQILTKRPARMLAFFRWLLEQEEMSFYALDDEKAAWWLAEAVSNIGGEHPAIKALDWKPATNKRGGYDNCGPGWPYVNVWLGVSVEDQSAADERIPLLLQSPAAVRFLSCEPLLGEIDLTRVCDHARPRAIWINCIEAKDANPAHAELVAMLGPDYPYSRIDWVIAGGESGPGARPMHPDWARSLRDQCATAGVPFLFKQWGEWEPFDYIDAVTKRRLISFKSDKKETLLGSPGDPKTFQNMRRVGKKTAGRLLDGREHNAFPEQSA